MFLLFFVCRSPKTQNAQESHPCGTTGKKETATHDAVLLRRRRRRHRLLLHFVKLMQEEERGKRGNGTTSHSSGTERFARTGLAMYEGE